MLSKKAIIFYWILILAPTVIIAVWGQSMIQHEQERIIRLEKEAARGRVEALAQGIQVTIRDFERELIQTLEGMYTDDKPELVKRLLNWKSQDPFVRCAFLFDSKQGLIFPSGEYGATSDEMGFIARYDALVTGRVSWTDSNEKQLRDETSEQSGQTTEIDELPGNERSKKISKHSDGFLDLLRMGRTQGKGAFNQSLQINKQAPNPPKGGWLPWFADNRLNILVWENDPTKGLIWGIEIEMMTLLSRLIPHFNPEPPEGYIYGLMDDSGDILHQLGKGAVPRYKKPDISVSLEPELPRWKVIAHRYQGSSSGGAGSSFTLIASLSLATVLIALLSGAGLLTWQAHRNLQEARMKSSFVSNVSHELKTPLTSIRMYAELMAQGRIKDPEKNLRYLEVISSEAQRLARLVNNVLGLGRMEKGRMVYQPVKLNLFEFTTGVLRSQETRLLEAGMDLDVSASDDQVEVFVDKDALEQVILNLLDNAIKYASQGIKLRIFTDKSGPYARIVFIDHGPGIPRGMEEKVFEKFTRLDDSLTTKQPGTGLGLTISRAVLRDMGGDLIYHRDLSLGAAFIVSIPLVSTESPNDIGAKV